MTTETLPQPLPEDWRRALTVVAHPDDLEYGASSVIARWAEQGKEVTELLVTRGEAGIDTIPPEECARLRSEEQMAAARAVGAKGVEFLDFPDGTLEYGLELRRALARAIREHRPDMVVSINFRERFGEDDHFNHPDHRVLGPALLDAVRDADNRWVFRDQLAEGLAPWQGVRYVAFANAPRVTHYVPLTEDHLAAGIASIQAHEVYLENLGDTGMPDFLRENAEREGRACGVPLAVTFETFRA